MGLRGFLRRIGGVILSPGETLEIIVHEKVSLLEPLLLIVCFEGLIGFLRAAAVISFLRRVVGFLSFLAGSIPWIPRLTGITSAFIFPASATFSIVFSLVVWVLWGGIAHLVAKHGFNGTGDYVTTLRTLGYAEVPRFISIIGVLFTVFSPLAIFIALALRVLGVIWQAAIATFAMMKSHGLSGGSAFIAGILIPAVVLLVIGLLVIFVPFMVVRW